MQPQYVGGSKVPKTLHDIFKSGSFKELKEFLTKNGFKARHRISVLSMRNALKVQDTNGCTPLHMAVIDGGEAQYNMLEHLIRIGVLQPAPEEPLFCVRTSSMYRLYPYQTVLEIAKDNNTFLMDGITSICTLLHRNRVHILFDNANTYKKLEGKKAVDPLILLCEEGPSISPTELQDLLQGTDAKGDTPLHIAAYWGYSQHRKLIEGLKLDSIQQGVITILNLTNQAGNTPYSIAKIKDHHELYSLLQTYTPNTINTNISLLERKQLRCKQETQTAEKEARKDTFSGWSIASWLFSTASTVLAAADAGLNEGTTAKTIVSWASLGSYLVGLAINGIGLRSSYNDVGLARRHLTTYNKCSCSKGTTLAAIAGGTIGAALEGVGFFAIKDPVAKAALTGAGPLVSSIILGACDAQLKAEAKYYANPCINPV